MIGLSGRKLTKRIVFLVGLVLLSVPGISTAARAQTVEETVAFLLFGFENTTRTSLGLTEKINNNTWESRQLTNDARGQARAYAANLSKAEVEKYFETYSRTQILQHDACRYVIKWENLEADDIEVVVAADFSSVHAISIRTNGNIVDVSLAGGTITLAKIAGRNAKSSTTTPSERDESFSNALMVPDSHLSGQFSAGAVDAYAARLRKAAEYLRSQFCKGRLF